MATAVVCLTIFFFNDTATTEIYTLSLYDALRSRLKSIFPSARMRLIKPSMLWPKLKRWWTSLEYNRSEEHTSELQSLRHLVCRLLLEKKNTLIMTTCVIFNVNIVEFGATVISIKAAPVS